MRDYDVQVCSSAVAYVNLCDTGICTAHVSVDRSLHMCPCSFRCMLSSFLFGEERQKFQIVDS
jgi:hypothetical protein